MQTKIRKSVAPVAAYPWKSLLLALTHGHLYSSIPNVYSVCIPCILYQCAYCVWRLPMETRSWPPVGRSHWLARVGKLFGGKLLETRNVFLLAQWEKSKKKLEMKKLLTVKVDKVELNSCTGKPKPIQNKVHFAYN